MSDLPMYSVQEVSTSNSLIKLIINNSLLDSQANKCPWILTKAEIVLHAQFDREYEEKKAETMGFSPQDDTGCNLMNKYGFCTESDDQIIKEMLQDGLMISNTKYNTLGYHKCGAYVTRYLDVCLKYYHFQNPSDDFIRVVIFKYFLGKVTKCVPKAPYATEIIEPTQGFDAHQSVIEPSPDEPIHQQFEKSQVYLYEFDSLRAVPVYRPRQCVPIAVLSYAKDKMLEAEIYRTRECAKMTSSDLEDSASQCSNNSQGGESLKGNDRFANNPQLKAIVDAINSRPINSAPILPRRKRISGTAPNAGAVVENSVPVTDRLRNNPQLKAIVDQINSRPASENAPMLPPRNGRGGRGVTAGKSHLVAPNYAANDSYFGQTDSYYDYECDQYYSASELAYPWQTHEQQTVRSIGSNRGSINQTYRPGGGTVPSRAVRGGGGNNGFRENQKLSGTASINSYWDGFEYGTASYQNQYQPPRQNENGAANNFNYQGYSNNYYAQSQNHRAGNNGAAGGAAMKNQVGRGTAYRGRGRGRGLTSFQSR